MAIEPGTRLGHYEILAPLGTGGMGDGVCRAPLAALHQGLNGIARQWAVRTVQWLRRAAT